ncbi:MAG: ATP cone domain-containing protein, partial [Candidatus Thiodiazotropha lotti]
MQATIARQRLRTPSKIVKRDGSEADFDPSKIQNAILLAAEASGEFGDQEATLITAQVVKVLTHTGYRQSNPGIERIQDVVEQVLISANHLQTARAYIVYREQHKKLRQDRRTLLDVASSVNEYLQR